MNKVFPCTLLILVSLFCAMSAVAGAPDSENPGAGNGASPSQVNITFSLPIPPVLAGIITSQDEDTSGPVPASPPLVWQKSLGGNDTESAQDIQKTPDGGYIIAGYTDSQNGDVSGNHGGRDAWIVKLNNTGTVSWKKCYGGTGTDLIQRIAVTKDGGYITAGYTGSDDGDVTGNHGMGDAWVMKLTDTGAISWQKCLGGSGRDWGYDARETRDSGYIVAATAASDDGDVSGNHGREDAWIVKLDTSGAISWQESLGGSGSDRAYRIRQTGDGGYIFTGPADSHDGDISGDQESEGTRTGQPGRTGTSDWQENQKDSMNYPDNGIRSGDLQDRYLPGTSGLNDYWLVRLTGSGDIIWDRIFGEDGNDYSTAVEETNDGGCIVSGGSYRWGEYLSGDGDYLIVKLSGNGSMIWQTRIGGSGEEVASDIRKTEDGGYIVSGLTTSHDRDVAGNYGKRDFWVVKLTARGEVGWSGCLGGSRNEIAYGIVQADDGGYVVVGDTWSHDGDVTGNHGKGDVWIARLGKEPSSVSRPEQIPWYEELEAFFVNLTR